MVQYEAGKEGFLARGDVGPDQETMRVARKLAAEDYRDKQPFLDYWNLVANRQHLPPNWAQTKAFSQIRAQHPPKEQDWTSGRAVQSFMQSLNLKSPLPSAKLVAAPLVPEPPNPLSIRPPPSNTVFARYSQSDSVPEVPPQWPTLPEATPLRATSNQDNPIGNNFHFTVNHGGPEGYKYSVSY